MYLVYQVWNWCKSIHEPEKNIGLINSQKNYLYNELTST